MLPTLTLFVAVKMPFVPGSIVVVPPFNVIMPDPSDDPVTRNDPAPDFVKLPVFEGSIADSNVTLEVGTEKYAAKAAPVDRAERDRVYAIMAAKYPNFAEYETKTTRVIPVVKLEKA